MSKAESPGASSHNSPELTPSEDGDLASFPKPPLLPRERAARAERKPKPPPIASTPASRQGRAAEPPPLAPDGPIQRPWASQRRWPIFGLAALILLGVGAGFYFSINRPENSVAEVEEEPLRAKAYPTTSLVGGGRLLIDARPWGEVTSLLNSDGEEVQLPLDRQTPLVLDLAPGLYTVQLTHPEVIDQSLSCEVQVSANVGGLCRLDLLSVTTEDYWEDAGWWR